MKRFVFVLMIFVLLFSVLTMNTMLAFAEGENDETAGTEETVPDGEGTENGGEGTTPDGDGSENGGEETTPDGEGTENGGEETAPEGDGEGETEQTPDNQEAAPEPGSEEELNGLFAEMGAILGDIKNDFVEIVNNIINFIASNETYKSIAGIVLAVLGVLFIPILVAVLVIAYVAIAAIVIVSTALMSLLELVIGIIPGVAFII